MMDYSSKQTIPHYPKVAYCCDSMTDYSSKRAMEDFIETLA